MAPRPSRKQALAGVMASGTFASVCAAFAADSLSRRAELALIGIGLLAVIVIVAPRQRHWRDGQGTGRPVDARTRRGVVQLAGGVGICLAALLSERSTAALLALFAGVAFGMLPLIIRNRLMP
jgi:hypothetical protein